MGSSECEGQNSFGYSVDPFTSAVRNQCTNSSTATPYTVCENLAEKGKSSGLLDVYLQSGKCWHPVLIKTVIGSNLSQFLLVGIRL